MDNEVSTSISITISIIVVALVIGMLSLFTAMSQTFKRDAINSVADMQAETYATELLSTRDYGAIPAASAYIMLQKNASAIRLLTGNVYTYPVNKPEDLLQKQLMHKKVKVQVEKIGDAYDVKVVEEGAPDPVD